MATDPAPRSRVFKAGLPVGGLHLPGVRNGLHHHCPPGRRGGSGYMLAAFDSVQ
jgi:hypothetical protein